jgi:hypothetical protein
VGLALAVTVLALLVAGCGGGSSSSSWDPSQSAAGGEASAEFEDPTGFVGTIVNFGSEGSREERKAANVVVVKNLEARETGDWASQCATLNRVGEKEIPGVGEEERECSKLLGVFAQPINGTKEVREDQLSDSIAALRVDGEKGYALFHGKDGKDYALPLEKEGGTWKVSAVNTIELGDPKSKEESVESTKESSKSPKPKAKKSKP